MKKILSFAAVISLLFTINGVFIAHNEQARAQTSGTVVGGTISGAIVDVCPNIIGAQNELPAGMELDVSGNCVTPPLPVVDVCANLTGVQSAIPAGQYRDTNGNCYIQPTPPIDVCPNVGGTQIIVPTGYQNSPNGDCEEIPVDLCPNIPGVQAVVPEGMRIDSVEGCYTPEKVPQPVTKVVTPPPAQDAAEYTNIPAVFMPIVNAIPPEIRKALRETPPAVARSLPYWIYLVLAGTALGLFAQTFFEAKTIRLLLGAYEREKSIASQKDDFLMLASHYLLTPLTLMKGGIDTIVALKEATPEAVQPLKFATASLQARIDDILANINSNSILQGIRQPEDPETPKSPLKSPFFIGSIIASVVLTMLINFLFGIVGEIDLGMLNLIVQGVVLIAVLAGFYVTIRAHTLKKQQRIHHERLVSHERAIDDARTKFIDDSMSALSKGLNDINAAKAPIEVAPNARFFMEGYNRFVDILGRFSLLSKVRNGVTPYFTKINVEETINKCLAKYQAQIAEKNLLVVNNVPNMVIEQNPEMFEFVLNSVVDNAVKFSSANGALKLEHDPENSQFKLTILDNGIGIHEDKLPSLFQPFSRGESVTTFNYEGLGFSLFLDRIIMDYTGGDIAIESIKDKGTRVTMTTPVAYAAPSAQ